MKFLFSGRHKVALCLSVIIVLFLLVSASDALSQTFGTGTFQGIMQSESDNDESFGFISLVLNSSGTFSVKFNLGVNGVGGVAHHYYAKSGKFDENGHYHFEGPDPHDTRYAVARVIDFQLDSLDSPTRITGEMTDLTHSSTVEMEKLAVGNAAPQAGGYTFLFSSGDDGVAHNNGFGRVVVARSGHLVANGRAPDGRPFSQTANLTVYDRWPVFAKMAGVTNGILSGWLTFEDAADSDFTGQLVWLGPEVNGPNHAYVPAFSGTVSTTGSRYVPHSGPALDVGSPVDNVHMTLSDGGLEGPIDRDLTLTSANRVVFDPKMAGDSLAINSATGLFTGTFKHSDGRIYPFRGAILQKSNVGGGQFVVRGGESGNVSLNAQ